jgi:hypothetical protein
MQHMGLLEWQDPLFLVHRLPSYPWLQGQGIMASQKDIRAGKWSEDGERIGD